MEVSPEVNIVTLLFLRMVNGQRMNIDPNQNLQRGALASTQGFSTTEYLELSIFLLAQIGPCPSRIGPDTGHPYSKRYSLLAPPTSSYGAQAKPLVQGLG